MSRPALLFVVLSMLAAGAQAQLFTGAPPASAVSPTADGRTHGAPASVLSPKVAPFVPGHGPRFVTSAPVHPFGARHRHDVFIPVPVFYAIYSPGFDNGYGSPADPAVPQETDPSATADSGNSVDEEALRQAYLNGVRDAMGQKADSRYGQHYMDARESLRAKSPAASAGSSTTAPMAAPDPDPKPVIDNSPATVFIFKDGHTVETRNYAIVGQTLYDFSTNSLKKVQLADLDRAATTKANDDRGTTVKLP
jgi:hypothetical protein